MDAFWQLDAPWWTVVLRGALIYLAVLLFVRLSGKRTVGEFTPFDLVVLILIGEASQNGLIGDDHSVLGAWIAAGTLIGINFAMGWATARSKTLERWIDGEPQLLAHDGRLLRAALKRNNISTREFDQALRVAKSTVEEVKVALLEVDGKITIVKRDESAPWPAVKEG